MKRILLIVDVQRDFCPGGSLAVSRGEAIIPAINTLSQEGGFDWVLATQDWHPTGHISFASVYGKQPFDSIKVSYGDQVLWPDHCVQGGAGAEFHPLLDVKPVNFIVRKGYRKDIDSYSGFFENDKRTETGLDALLKGLSGPEGFSLFVCGIATDVCVYNTAHDAKKLLAYRDVSVISDACAGVDEAASLARLKELEKLGVTILKSRDAMGILR